MDISEIKKKADDYYTIIVHDSDKSKAIKNAFIKGYQEALINILNKLKN